MLLNQAKFKEPMKLVYQVQVKIKQDPEHVKRVQELTLNKQRPTRGLNGTYGLYGSSEWLENLESGIIPRKQISGVIQDVYRASMDSSGSPDQIDILLDGGGIISKGIYINHRKDLKLFRKGKMVEILCFIEDMKLIDHGVGKYQTHEFVLEMAVSL